MTIRSIFFVAAAFTIPSRACVEVHEGHRGGRRSRLRAAAYSDGPVLPGTRSRVAVLDEAATTDVMVVCAASDTGEPTIIGERNAGPSPSERSGSGGRALARHLRDKAPRPSRAKPPTSSTSGGGTSTGPMR
jgi:hypothetical protein